MFLFFFSSRRRHTRLVSDWSSDVCSSDLPHDQLPVAAPGGEQDDDQSSKCRCNRTFRQRRDPNKDIKQKKPSFPCLPPPSSCVLSSAFCFQIPHRPSHHREREERCKRHVGVGSASEAEDRSRCRRDQRRVQRDQGTNTP